MNSKLLRYYGSLLGQVKRMEKKINSNEAMLLIDKGWIIDSLETESFKLENLIVILVGVKEE